MNTSLLRRVDPERLALVAILLGTLVRFLWVLILHPPYEHLYSDMDGYVDRAVKFASGGDLVRYDAFYPPGTHLLLALPLALLGTEATGLRAAALLWLVLSALTPFFAWRLVRDLVSPAAGAAAAVLAAAWPLHIAYAGFFSSETPSLTFLVGSVWLVHRAGLGARIPTRSAWPGGLLGGLAIACRPQFVLSLAVAMLPVLRRGRAAFATLAAVGLGALAIVVAVMVHNSAATGRLTGLSENSGVVFFMGHCDVNTVTTGSRDQIFYLFASPVATQRGGGANYHFADHQVWDSGFFFQQGLECIRRDGLAHLGLELRMVLDMLATTVPWPPSNDAGLRDVVRVTNTGYALGLPVIVAFTIARIRDRGRRGWLSAEMLLLLQLVPALVTAVVFFGDPRYRVPYDIFGLSLLAILLTEPAPAPEASTDASTDDAPEARPADPVPG